MKDLSEDVYQEQHEREFRDFEEAIDRALNDEGAIGGKIEEIDALIEHVNSRVTYTESRITRAVTISLSLIGFGMAFLAAVTRLQGISYFLGIGVSLTLVGTGLLASYVHSRQINPPYPFRKLKNDWKWFYPQIVKEQYRPSMFVKEDAESFNKKRLWHIEGLKEYSVKLINEDEKARIRVDLQQLYLLHVNEKYKNCFLSTITHVIKVGVAVISVLFMALAISLVIKRPSGEGNLKGSSTHSEHARSMPGDFRLHHR